MTKNAIIINDGDNVAVALADLQAGKEHEGVTLKEDIPSGHKFALCDIAEGEAVIKFANTIARATEYIPAGAHVHTHNCRSNLADNLDYAYNKTECVLQEAQPRPVNVYRRRNGSFGIRNELWIIPLVGCVNGQAKLILNTFKSRYGTKGFDGVFAFTHPYGCSQLGGDLNRTKSILQKLVRHPNAGGVLVLGLGCESNDLGTFRKSLGAVDENRVKFLNCRDVEDEIEAGVRLLNSIAELMKNDVREQADISCLKIGLKCSGSDMMSGITANPLVGKFSDYIVSAGGTAIFTEVSEIFGAEQLLMNRAADQEVFNKTVDVINDYKEYFRCNGQSVYRSLSRESTAAGYTTVEEKSLACTQKSGCANIADVVPDAGEVTRKGLNLLSGADNAMCAVTALAAAGCHMVLFTTGKGTPFGGCIPAVKISSNSALASKKSNWIDFDAGRVAENGYEERLEQLINLAVAVANGKLTKNEINNAREIAILKTGITL